MGMEHWYKYGKELLDEISLTTILEKSIAIWFLGQESLVVKGGNIIIYIDPFLTDYIDSQGMSKRRFPPPFKPCEVNHADLIFCTHNHIDHLNPETLSAMALNSANAKFIVPAPHVSILESIGISSGRILAAKADEGFKIDNISVIPVASAHEEYKTDEFGNHINLGYGITIDGITLYHAGDTVETQEMVDTLRNIGTDIVCLPINGNDWERRKRDTLGNMNAREAANVADECGADLVIPLHYDLFAGNGENPAHFTDYMNLYHPGKKHHIMVPGERFIYMK